MYEITKKKMKEGEILMSNKAQDQMKDLTDRLEQGIKDVYESDRYKNYLSVMSKFYSYSFRNSILIMLQKPDASHVAGFNAWKDKFNRYVNKGEKGIQILAPAPYRVKVPMQKLDPITQKPVIDSSGKPITEEVEVTKPAFRPVYVFDASQTSGEPLPELTKELTGSVSQYNIFFESLKSVSPFPIEMEDIQGGAKGYCDPVNNKIAIKNGMSEVQTIKTAIHEITHADLHAPEVSLSMQDRTDRRTKEVEAESVAFIVCDHYGIDTSDYSFAYVASWSSDKELNELKNSLDTIQKQAAELIDRIDTRFKDLQREQPILPMPDHAITVKDMEQYGYAFNESNKMLPLGKEKAIELFKNDDPIYILYSDNTEAIPDTLEQLEDHYNSGGISGIELVDWEGIIEFRALKNEISESLDGAMKELKERTIEENLTTDVQNSLGELDPHKEPIVTIGLSEHSTLTKGLKLTLADADKAFEKLDKQQNEDRQKPEHTGSYYDKVNFSIEYQKDGELRTYSGRQDIGDGEGGLINHILNRAESNLTDDFIQNWMASKGPDEKEKFNAEMKYIINETVPYFKMHDNLSDLEALSKSALVDLTSIKDKGGVIDLDNRINYHNDLLKYIDATRLELNTSVGDYKLPEMPRLENYLTEKASMDQYKEQVQAEIKQEALSAGMTVESYANNNFTVPEVRTFTIYQLTSGEENHYRRFESYESLENQGEVPDINNYKAVYSGKIDPTVTLENIYQEFNINRPADFKGHSLSMSDIVVIEANDKFTANYVDTFGFKSCPDFAAAHEHRLNKEILDSVKFDNDIDQDKEKKREQLGFKDDKKPSVRERMAAAKETSKSRSEASKATSKETAKEKPKKATKKEREDM